MKIKDVIPEKHLNDVENYINAFFKIQESISDKLEKPINLMQEFIQKNQEVFTKIIDFKINLNNKINSVLRSPKVLTFFNNLNKIIKEYPEKLRLSILKLAEYGWFIDFKRINISNILLYQKYIENESEEVNNELCIEYNKHLNNILTDLVEKYPKRKVIITKAFQAHNNKDYELSIPTLLTQIDGICKDEIDKEFFLSSKNKKNKSTPKTAEFFNDYRFNTIVDSLLEPLKIKTAINYSKNERKELHYVTINRHEVLHGESTTYATEINSYKVISLLSYINSIFSEVNIKGK